MPATAPRIFTARFDGTCPKCGAAIRMGDPVQKAPGAKAHHFLCEIPAGRPIARCACGSSMSPRGLCDDLMLNGSHIGEAS
jgi:hypothetical protein